MGGSVFSLQLAAPFIHFVLLRFVTLHDKKDTKMNSANIFRVPGNVILLNIDL